jgi:hypothetical protein
MSPDVRRNENSDLVAWLTETSESALSAVNGRRATPARFLHPPVPARDGDTIRGRGMTFGADRVSGTGPND